MVFSFMQVKQSSYDYIPGKIASTVWPFNIRYINNWPGISLKPVFPHSFTQHWEYLTETKILNILYFYLLTVNILQLLLLEFSHSYFEVSETNNVIVSDRVSAGNR